MDTVRPMTTPRCFLSLLLLCGGLAVPAAAQEGATLPEAAELSRPAAERDDKGVHFRLRGDGEYVGQSGFHGSDAEAGFWRAGAQFGAEFPGILGERSLLDLSLDTEHTRYRFDGHELEFDGEDPFDGLWRHALTGRLTAPINEKWSWIVGAQAQWAGEDEAAFDGGFTWRVYGGALYSFSDRVQLGAGVGYQTRIEDDAFFLPLPFIMGRISLTEKVRIDLALPQTAALTYQAREDLSFSLQGSVRFDNYRLADDGPIPDGVVKQVQVPVGVWANWAPSRRIELRGGVGAYVWQSFEISDDEGDEVFEADAEPAPFLAAGVTFRF